jgi:hypothetical protein
MHDHSDWQADGVGENMAFGTTQPPNDDPCQTGKRTTCAATAKASMNCQRVRNFDALSLNIMLLRQQYVVTHIDAKTYMP